MEDFYSYHFIILGIIFAIPSLLYKEDTGSWYLDNRLNLRFRFARRILSTS